MTLPRFRSRHLLQTCLDHIETGLRTAGWIDAPVNFGTTPVTFLEVQPSEGGITVAPNTVAVTLGDEPEDRDEELGAGLQSCDYTLFVDIYGASNSVSMSLADDIKTLLKHTALPLVDYGASATGVPTDHRIEFHTVVVDRPNLVTGLDKRYWRTVKATAALYFTD